MPTVLLVRHGESQSNVGLATSDPVQVELTDKGWQQAGYIAKYLEKTGYCLDLIITSSYLRTKRTAALTTLSFPNVPEEEWPVKEFTYLSQWLHRTSTTDERRTYADAYWQLANPQYNDGPGAESFEEFIRRVRKVKRQLEQSELDTIVIFTHEQFIAAFVWLAQQDRLPEEMTPEMMHEFRAGLLDNPLQNGGIVQAKFHKGYEGWSCERIVLHLKEGEAVSAHAMV